MASSPGIWAGNLAPMHRQLDAENGIVPFLVGCSTVAGTSTYRLHLGHAPFTYVVASVIGSMTGAGGAGDTIQLTDKAGNAITELINVAALADNAQFQAQTIDNAFSRIEKYDDDLIVLTTSGALCQLAIIGFRIEV